MRCVQCRNVFSVIGDALNQQVETERLLEMVAKALVEEFGLKACHFRLISRDRKMLEDVASYGLSEAFLAKGPVDAERSVVEAVEGKIVIVPDCTSDPRIQYPLEHAEEGIVSQVNVPLVSRGQVIGVMRLSAGEPREFSDEELELFKMASLFCSSAIVHSMFHQILAHVTEAIRSSLDLEEVLEAIVHVVADDLRAKGCTIRLLDPTGRSLELRAACGLSRRYLDATLRSPGKALRAAIETGRCVAIGDARSDPRIHHIEEVLHERITSILFVPLMSRGQAIGVLSLYTHRRYDFSEDETELMMAIGEQCALAIRNAQMYAALKKRYESVVDDFQQWFEHYQAHTLPTPNADG